MPVSWQSINKSPKIQSKTNPYLVLSNVSLTHLVSLTQNLKRQKQEHQINAPTPAPTRVYRVRVCQAAR